MNKLIWKKKDKKDKAPQFEFEMPYGFKVYSFEDVIINSNNIIKINCGVFIKSQEPITLLFSSNITTVNFKLLTEFFIVPPHEEVDLILNVTNPCYNQDIIENKTWILKKGTCVANMIILNTSYTNLFQLSQNEFEKS